MVDLKDISLTCTVHLGQLELSAEEYGGLRTGDIVVLNQVATGPLEMRVNGRATFRVMPGLEGMRKAVVIRDERANN